MFSWNGSRVRAGNRAEEWELCGLTYDGNVCYAFRVTENISIRPRRPGLKAELARKARPNINAWLNNLIERELAIEPNDWREILRGPRPVASDEAFEQCLKPE